MDNDIRVVTDKEVYLLASPAISKSESETTFRTWLRTSGALKPELIDAIKVVGINDLLLPMSVTSVDSWGNWSLLQGSFQKRAFDRDQRQYERDYLAYQQEEKKHHAARERGENYTLPPLPRSPNRDDYYEYFPEHGEYATSFKGILRAFGEEALGQAKPYLNDIAIALDNLLRSRFPAAAPAATPPGAINRDVLNTLVDEYVSDRGIDWVKEQAAKYETAKKLEISEVNYRRECNIVFLPVRVIEYDFNGKIHVAVSDPIRNEYVIGTPPAMAPAAPARPTPVPAKGKMNFGLIGGAAAAAVVVIGVGVTLMSHSGKHPAPAAVQAPAAPSNNAPAATAPQDNAAQQADQQAQQLAAAQAAQKAAQEAADKVAAQAAQQLAAQQAQQQAAIEQAAKQAAAAQAAQDAAAVEAAQEAAAAQAAEQAATAHAAQLATAAQAEKDAAAQAAAQQAAQAAAQDAADKQQAAKAAQKTAQQQEAAAKVAQQKAQEAAAAQAAEEEAAAQAAAAVEKAREAKLAASANTPPAAALPVGKTAAISADSLTAEANASPGPAAPAAQAAQVVASAKPAEKTAATKAAPVPVESPAAAQSVEQKEKAAVQSSGGNDLAYYNLGVAAQRAGDVSAARTYYQLSMQHSQTNNPPSTCSPRHQATYEPSQCHGVVLPGRAARALATLPPG